MQSDAKPFSFGVAGSGLGAGFGAKGGGFPSLHSVFGGSKASGPVSLFSPSAAGEGDAEATNEEAGASGDQSGGAAGPERAAVKMADEPVMMGDEDEECLFNEQVPQSHAHQHIC